MAVELGARAEPATSDSGGGESPEKKEDAVEVSGVEVERALESEVAELRRRWELASVLNFLIVFEPVIGRDLKISAEEIEAGLISPNASLAQLHITLLKGIPPVSKALDGSDAWVTVLCKKLAPWWPWVAEGEVPLVVAKGEEISGYKGLDPMKRLLILKALCEIRVEQDDTLAYINDALKQGTDISSFRKEKIGGDRNGAAFWYEGNSMIGHRLYRGVIMIDSTETSNGKKYFNPPSFQWETMATNLEEFRNIVDKFSSSNVAAETVVGRTIQAEAIPVLEKHRKKKELAITRKQRQEMLKNNNQRTSYVVRATRSCRYRRPVNYTYDDYDQAISEAIRVATKETEDDEHEEEKENGKSGRKNSADTDGYAAKKTELNDCTKGGKAYKSGQKDDAMDIDMILDDSSDDEDYVYSNKGEGDADSGDNSDFSDSGNFKPDRKARQRDSVAAHRHFGVRWSIRLAGDTSQPFMEIGNLGTKKSTRQRPTLNSAMDSVVVPDSEDDS